MTVLGFRQFLLEPNHELHHRLNNPADGDGASLLLYLRRGDAA